MPILALSTNASISAWETSTTNADLLVDGVPLTGVAAAAYLYGQALTTVRFEGTLDGVQLADGRFQFPPAQAPAVGPDNRQWVSLTDVADALRYKYGVDPLIEFSPGLGSRGYSIPDINRILELLNREFSGQFSLPLIASAAVLAATQATFGRERTAAASGATYNATAVATLLNTASTNLLTPATSAELHDNLTEGGDIYVDRNGAFYINGIRTRAMDLAVTSRVLVQENLSAEYKEMMDDLAERNNLITAARTVNAELSSSKSTGISTAERNLLLIATAQRLEDQYGDDNMLSVLTAGQVKLDTVDQVRVGLVLDAMAQLPAYFDRLDTRIDALETFYAQAITDAQTRRERYVAQGWNVDSPGTATVPPKYNLVGQIDALIAKYTDFLARFAEGRTAVGTLRSAVGGSYAGFEGEIERLSDATKPDVFAWLKTFDVDPDYLWDRDWDRLNVTVKSLTLSEGFLDGPDQNAGGFGFGGGYDSAWDFGSDLFVFPAVPPPLVSILIEIGKNQPDGPFDWSETDFGWSDVTYPFVFNDPFSEDAIQTRYLDYYNSVTPPGNYTLSQLRNSVRTLLEPPYWHENNDFRDLGREWARMIWSGDLVSDQGNEYGVIPGVDTLKYNIGGAIASSEYDGTGRTDSTAWGVFDWEQWALGGAQQKNNSLSTLTAYQGAGPGYSDAFFLGAGVLTSKDLDNTESLLNTLISNKVRDGDLDQAKLQSITGQLQNNTEAMTALIKAFSDLNAALVQALR